MNDDCRFHYSYERRRNIHDDDQRYDNFFDRRRRTGRFNGNFHGNYTRRASPEQYYEHKCEVGECCIRRDIPTFNGVVENFSHMTTKEHYQQYHKCRQGSNSVGDYTKEFQRLLSRNNLGEYND